MDRGEWGRGSGRAAGEGYAASVDLLPSIADERHRAADLIASLSAEQLATPSLCTGWTVHDVAAHLLMPLVTSIPRVAVAMLSSRFDFDRANVKLTAAVAARSDAEIVAGLRARANHPFKPPGLGYEAPLTDLLVHQQDIRRPLGLPARLEPDRLRVALDLLFGRAGNSLRGGRQYPELRWEATDLDWSRGSGIVVSGTAEALLMALAGRSVVLAELAGDGLPVLRQAMAG